MKKLTHYDLQYRVVALMVPHAKPELLVTLARTDSFKQMELPGFTLVLTCDARMMLAPILQPLLEPGTSPDEVLFGVFGTFADLPVIVPNYLPPDTHNRGLMEGDGNYNLCYIPVDQ